MSTPTTDVRRWESRPFGSGGKTGPRRSSTSLRAPADYSSEFAEYLRSLGYEAVLIGALAAITYRREERMTTDVDFLVRSLDGLGPRLEADGYEVRAITEHGESTPYLLFVRGQGVKVDILAVETAFQASAFERAKDGTLTVEDVLVFKLLAWRPRDQDDVASILAAGHKLDESYIDRWVNEWGVADRWAEAHRLSPER